MNIHGMNIIKMQQKNKVTVLVYTSAGSCLSADFLTPQWHDILDFSNCPLSRVLHVTLANWQEFGFEFHLRSSPSYSEYMDISLPAEYFI